MNDDIILIFLGVILVVIGVMVGVGVYNDITSEKIVLNKSKWECVENKIMTNLITQPSGSGGVILVPSVINKCVKYKYKN